MLEEKKPESLHSSKPVQNSNRNIKKRFEIYSELTKHQNDVIDYSKVLISIQMRHSRSELPYFISVLSMEKMNLKACMQCALESHRFKFVITHCQETKLLLAREVHPLSQNCSMNLVMAYFEKSFNHVISLSIYFYVNCFILAVLKS